MQFIDNDPLYKLVRITGPTHNLLGLQISRAAIAGEPEVEALDQASGAPAGVDAVGGRGGLDGREVAAQVRLGVEQACTELQRTYHVDKIQYLSTDSPPVTIYRQLAAELIRRVHAARSS
jgi:hypothetical protein